MIWSFKNGPAWPLLALVCVTFQAHSASVASVQVSRQGARFLIGMRLRVDAPPQAVFQALQDYSALPRYTLAVRSVHVVHTATPSRVLLFTTLHACVLFFCKTMFQEQVMTASPDAHGGVLRSVLLPQGSDFKRGHGRWTVRPCTARKGPSCVDVSLMIVPAFWVPPLIGPWLIRHKMREEARLASVGLQRIALRYVKGATKAQETLSSYHK